jgi:hypothetical protein
MRARGQSKNSMTCEQEKKNYMEEKAKRKEAACAVQTLRTLRRGIYTFSPATSRAGGVTLPVMLAYRLVSVSASFSCSLTAGLWSFATTAVFFCAFSVLGFLGMRTSQ